jgi:hypothetical protein
MSNTLTLKTGTFLAEIVAPSGTGAVTLTGAAVGDIVMSPTVDVNQNVALGFGNFESIISVANEIQLTNAFSPGNVGDTMQFVIQRFG